MKKEKKLVEIGKVDEAIAAYEEAHRIDPESKVSANAWGTLGRFGCLYGYVEKHQILMACEKAVEAEPDVGEWYDVRGLAKALMGKEHFTEAMVDFQLFVAWTTNERERIWRKRWISDLRKGRNPITQKEIARLLRQGKLLVLNR